MKLADKVEYYRNCEKYDRILRQIRLRVYEYEDAGLYPKALRIIRRIKAYTERRDRNRSRRIEDRFMHRYT